MTPVAAGTIVTSWSSPKYGSILVDSRGYVLYLFTPDVSTTPTCTGSCAQLWPPFEPTKGAPEAEGGVQQSKLAVNNGQIDYFGHPLYFYAGDSGPHQTNGQGSSGIWYVVGLDGSAVGRP